MYKPFRIRRAHNEKGESIGFYLVTISENGRILHTSQVYTRKRACRANVRALARLMFSAVPAEKITNYIEDETIEKKS